MYFIWREWEIALFSNQAIPQLKLDQEWIDLMLEAKKVGFTIDEIRSFLKRETIIHGIRIVDVQKKYSL